MKIRYTNLLIDFYKQLDSIKFKTRLTFILAWIAPVAGCVGGILVIALLVFIVLWWRRRKDGPQNLSPIDDKVNCIPG